MAEIKTLVHDIETILTTPTGVSNDDVSRLGQRIADTVALRLAQPERQPSLRMSNIGNKCERKLYYSINEPRRAEPLTAAARLKFLYGDILEHILLFLAKSAGHTVVGEQDELEINGVKGHRDAVIDGVTVDVKSASTKSFEKFEQGLVRDSDAFGYLDQLKSYVRSGEHDELVSERSKGAFLVVDKQLGHICLDQHTFENLKEIDADIERKKAIVDGNRVPPRSYFDEPDGKSGNRKLGTVCSYCEFKQHCWPEARLYQYAGRPRWLTHVVREPRVEAAGG